MPITKTPALNKNQALTLIRGFFQQFQNCINQPKSHLPSTLDKFLSPNFQLLTNGRIASRNFTEYLNRLETLKKKYSHIEIKGPQEEPHLSENHITLHYQLELTTPNQQKSLIYIMAIGTIEDNKISRWIQVTHEKGTSHWDT